MTHSLCSLEFENHRPLYDWVINNASAFEHKPRQIEFARLNIDPHGASASATCASWWRSGLVDGWDDPRMPTLCGLRRRGYTPASIRNFCDRIGVAKVNSTVEYGFLEHCLREDLNTTARRVMAVLHPVKLVLYQLPGRPERGVHRGKQPGAAGRRQPGSDFLQQLVDRSG